MTQYNFQLGFNWNSEPKEDPAHLRKHFPLQLVRVGGQVLKKGPYPFLAGVDSVCFDEFNVTEGADLSQCSIVGGAVKFILESFAGTPFNIDELKISNIGRASLLEHVDGTLFTDVAAGDYPFWSVVPLMQFTNRSKANGPYHFKFEIEIIVEGIVNGEVEKRLFFHDPEMIVDGVG
jgi:hypothetical protein